MESRENILYWASWVSQVNQIIQFDLFLIETPNNYYCVSNKMMHIIYTKNVDRLRLWQRFR